MQRIGVFICWCGSNIAATVDVVKVAEVIKIEEKSDIIKLETEDEFNKEVYDMLQKAFGKIQ